MTCALAVATGHGSLVCRMPRSPQNEIKTSRPAAVCASIAHSVAINWSTPTGRHIARQKAFHPLARRGFPAAAAQARRSGCSRPHAAAAGGGVSPESRPAAAAASLPARMLLLPGPIAHSVLVASVLMVQLPHEVDGGANGCRCSAFQQLSLLPPKHHCAGTCRGSLLLPQFLVTACGAAAAQSRQRRR